MQKNKPVILFGNSPTAKMVAWFFERDGIEVAAFTVDSAFVSETTFNNKPLIPFDELKQIYAPEDFGFHAAIGSTQINTLRAKVVEEAIHIGYEIVSLISKNAIVYEGFSIPLHCRIGDSAIIKPFVKAHANIVVADRVMIGHDSVIGANTYIAPGAIIGSSVIIGNNCFVGSGAVLRNKIMVGDMTIIGAGVTLLESAESGSVYMNTGSQKLQISSDQIKF